jgi:hypothetical protein
MGLGYILGDIFTNSSGHPDINQQFSGGGSRPFLVAPCKKMQVIKSVDD